MLVSRRFLRALVFGTALAVIASHGSFSGDTMAQGSGSGAKAGSGSGTGSGAAGKGSASGAATGAGNGSHAGHAKGDTSPSSQAFAAANAKMHKGMDIQFSGDADVDFVKGMIVHHEGAVEMAKIVLKYGKDPDIKKLAEEVVKAQESEIVFMRAWLQKIGK